MTQSSSGENDKVTVLRFATEEGEKERDNYQKKGKKVVDNDQRTGQVSQVQLPTVQQ